MGGGINRSSRCVGCEEERDNQGIGVLEFDLGSRELTNDLVD
jgi:hypothetical protein